MIKGLYMVQPYEPGKIPVVFIHGMWSSPMTWMEMFNDLRSSPDIRRHYQFWFYLYPTGQPFWLSAAQLRRDLAEMRQVLDPQHREPALDQMVLVGHSMGGLVARLQTLESGQDYWKLASRIPWEQVKAEPEVRQKLGETFYFHPNPSIRRVVTIATPYGGSTFSNQTTQYLLGKLIRLPATIVNTQQQLFRDNPEMLFPESLLKIENSIDSLVAEFADPVGDAGQPAGAVGQVQQHHRRDSAVLVAAHAGRSYRRRGERRQRPLARRRAGGDRAGVSHDGALPSAGRDGSPPHLAGASRRASRASGGRAAASAAGAVNWRVR